MSFNTNPNIQVQKVIFSCKIRKTSHLQLNFNSNLVKQVLFQKHLGVYLDGRLDFTKQPLKVFFKKGVLKIFVKFTGMHLCQTLFFNKVTGLMSATVLKRRFQYSCFSQNFVKFLRTCLLQNTSVRLFLDFCEHMQNMFKR